MADGHDYQPGDYSEMREGLPPPKVAAFARLDAEEVNDAIRLLSNRQFRVKVVVEDAGTGQELWWQRFDSFYRLGETVSIQMPLTLRQQ